MSQQRFRANVAYLEERSPPVGSRVAAVQSTVRVQVEAARSGVETITLAGPDGTRTAVHSAYDPTKEAERIVASIPDAGTYVLLGTGGGHVVRRLAATRPGSTIVLCEASIASLHAACHATDLATILASPGVELAVGPDEAVAALARVHLDILRPGLHTWELRPWTGNSTWTEDFVRCRAQVAAYVESERSDRATMERFGRHWALGPIRSLPLIEHRDDLAESVREVHRRIASRTVGIVAAGPGLDEHIGDLKRCDTLVCVDTALPALRARGVEPDVVVTLDAQLWSYLHFRTPLGKTQILVAEPSAPTAVLRRAPRVALGLGEHPFARLLAAAGIPHLPLATEARNVAGAAYALAATLGAAEIVTVGDDFRYRLGRAYARGTYLDTLARVGARRERSAETFWAQFVIDRTTHSLREAGGLVAVDPLLQRYGADMAERKRAFALRAVGAKPLRDRGASGQGAPSTRSVLSAHRGELEAARRAWKAIADRRKSRAQALLAALGPHGAAHLPYAYELRSRGVEDPVEAALAGAGAFIDRVFETYYSHYA